VCVFTVGTAWIYAIIAVCIPLFTLLNSLVPKEIDVGHSLVHAVEAHSTQRFLFIISSEVGRVLVRVLFFLLCAQYQSIKFCFLSVSLSFPH